MGDIPGRGLRQRNPDLTMQEHMNNVTAMQLQKDAPVLTRTRLAYRWRVGIEQHCESLNKKIRNLRQDALARVWGTKENSKGVFLQKLIEKSELNKSTLLNRFYVDRRRPGRELVDQLFEKLELSLEKKENYELYCSFGWYPGSVDQNTRWERLKKIYQEKAGRWSRAAEYLVLSDTTMDNIRTGINLHVSTAYRFIIALGDPEKTERNLELYHLFRMQPIVFQRDGKWICGEAEGIVEVSRAVYGPLVEKMDQELPGCGTIEFWSTLWTILDYCDRVYKVSIRGQLFYRDNMSLDTVRLPEGEE